jgi:NDP-sugar pyrophosphorylase family protein
MKALVLAAGEGKRLRPLTTRAPKAMVRVAGVPILERNVRLLAEHGVTEIAINVHHLASVIINHFGDGSGFGVSIEWSYEPKLLGTAGALVPLRSYFGEDPFWVVYGDNLLHCELSALALLHDQTGATATVALWQREDTTMSGVAELDGDVVVRFVEKPMPGASASAWVSAGVILCGPAMHNLVGQPPADFGRDVIPRAVIHGTVAGYRMRPPERVEWIDTPADLDRARRAFGHEPLS